MRRISLTLLLLATVFLSASAIPARPTLLTKTQPDGSKIAMFLRGDENFHLFVSPDGYPLVQGSDGYYRYARLSDGKLVSEGSPVAHNKEVRSYFETQYLAGVPSLAAMQIPQNSRYQKAPAKVSDTGFPTTGKIKGLIILAEFSDTQFAHKRSEFVRMMNEEGYSINNATGSARDYFMDQSMKTFLPEFTVVGPVKLPQTCSYYGKNDSYGNDTNPHLMIRDAAKLAVDSVNFADFDNDNNGSVDMVFVIYQGMGEADGGAASTVWPHKWSLSNGGVSLTLDGKKIDVYACASELDGNGSLCGIGAFCHEFGHVLGLADMYNTVQTDLVQLGIWDIMDTGCYNNNSHTPPAYSAFERYSLGWMTPTVLKNEDAATGVKLEELTANNVAYRLVNPANDNEYFLLENRQRKGWDAYTGGTGMMITHVDYKQNVWEANTVNNVASHPRVKIMAADGSIDLYNTSTDLFPSSKKKTEFTDTSSPSNSQLWNGNALDKPITNIAENNGLITFDFRAKYISGIEDNQVQTWSARCSDNTININGVNAGDKIDVYTVSGALVASQQVSGSKVSVSVPGEGVYVITKNGKETLKVTNK